MLVREFGPARGGREYGYSNKPAANTSATATLGRGCRIDGNHRLSRMRVTRVTNEIVDLALGNSDTKSLRKLRMHDCLSRLVSQVRMQSDDREFPVILSYKVMSLLLVDE